MKTWPRRWLGRKLDGNKDGKASHGKGELSPWTIGDQQTVVEDVSANEDIHIGKERGEFLDNQMFEGVQVAGASVPQDAETDRIQFCNKRPCCGLDTPLRDRCECEWSQETRRHAGNVRSGVDPTLNSHRRRD